MKKCILEKAKKVKLIASDIDGVFTAGELIIFDSGEEVKIWTVKDRFAHTLLKLSGLNIKIAWITARKSKQVETRADELNIDYLVQKETDKLKAFKYILDKENIDFNHAMFIGDDWLDIPALKKAGFSMCPRDSHIEVKKVVDYVSKFDGGKGVFREAVEIILKARKLYSKILKNYQ